MPHTADASDIEPDYRTVDVTYRGKNSPVDQKSFEPFNLVVSDHGDDPRARIRAIHFGAPSVAHVDATGVAIQWLPMLHSAAEDSVLFVLVGRGQIELSAGGHTLTVETNELSVVDTTTEAVNFVAEDAEFVCLSIERTLYASDAAPLAMQALLTNSAVFGPIYAFLASTTQVPYESGSAQVELMRDLTHDAAQALVFASAPRAKEPDIVTRALKIIHSHYQSTGFGFDEIVRQLGVSRRTLERAANDAGTGLTDEIRIARTTHALNLLTEQPEMLLSEVAAASGFASRESMRRAFQRYHEATPSSLRTDGSSRA